MAWYQTRWDILYRAEIPNDYYNTSIDIELIENQFVIGVDSHGRTIAIPIPNIVSMVADKK